MKSEVKRSRLVLSTGDVFEGAAIGAPLRSTGDLIFTTGMVGYAEALTDPSYFGQILVFTYPLIGNYGVPELAIGPDGPPRGFESARIHASAVIVGRASEDASHWSSRQTLHEWLEASGVPGVSGIDTRHLVHIVRREHQVLGRVEPLGSRGNEPAGVTRERVIAPGFARKPGQEFFDPGLLNVLPAVSTPERRRFGKGAKRVALLDTGVKWNIVRSLVEAGCEVELLPWDTKLAEVDCDGWVLSNGPGDPQKTGDLVSRVRGLLSRAGGERSSDTRPILGICLGHQLLALAAGARTERMPYGNRSHNQPVFEVGTRRGYMTSQNHGYVVVRGSLPEGWVPWFVNANDQTIEGIRHLTLPFRSVQFHPEACGGPRDTAWIITDFTRGL